MSHSKDQVAVQATSSGTDSSPSLPKDASVEVVQSPVAEDEPAPAPADLVEEKKKGFFAYFKTKEFYIVLILG